MPRVTLARKTCQQPVTFDAPASTGGVRTSVKFGSLCIELSSDAASPAQAAHAAHAAAPAAPAVIARPAPAEHNVPPEAYASVSASRLCWHCADCIAHADAKRLPVAYNALRRVFRFEGFFCSWECVRAYSSALDSDGVGRRSSLLSLLHVQLHDTPCVRIAIAAPKAHYAAFGGHVEYESARERQDAALNERAFSTRLSARSIAGSLAEWFTVEHGPAPRA
jgi:hypothetical protein